MKLLAEFKTFILRGNVVDMAVGIIVGAAFGAIVTSLVSDVLMPPIGWATGGVDFRDLAVELPGKMLDPRLKDKPPEELAKVPESERFVPVKIKYGAFIQKVLDFLIVGLCLFFVIKGMNALKRKREGAPPDPTPTEKLLSEIRDLMKKDS